MIDRLKILTTANEIPHGAQVSKRSGEMVYTISKSLKLYQTDGKTPITVEGIFLIKDLNINQIKPETQLHWLTTLSQLNFMNYKAEEETAQ